MSFPRIGRSSFRFSFQNGKLGRELIHDKEDPPRGSQQAMGGKSGGGLRIWIFDGVEEAPVLSKHSDEARVNRCPGCGCECERAWSQMCGSRAVVLKAWPQSPRISVT